MSSGPLLLCLETSTRACSVAVVRDQVVLALKESADENYSHAENLTVYIQEAIVRAGVHMHDLDAVVAGKGPGSFTGLRIGISAAKGICYALNKPLIGLNSLEIMAHGVLADLPKVTPFLLCPMTDARRMEVYCAMYDAHGKTVKETAAEIIGPTSFSEQLNKQVVYFFGDGASKCKDILTHPNARFIDGILPSAKHMGDLAQRRFIKKEFEDLAYFEPFYLKDFIGAKKP